jgi:hypothetical protein
MMAATALMGSASGIRSWVAARLGERLGVAAMRFVTVGLLGGGVILSGLLLNGTG